MGPDGPREDIQRAIARTGCRVRPDPARGGMFLVDCPTYSARADLVDIFATRDAHHDGAVRILALELTHDLPRDEDEPIARRIHARVRDRIRYRKEAGDCIQDPLVTWRYASGDCDCMTRLVLALCRTMGLEVELARFMTRGRAPGGGDEVQHVCPVWRGQWMETTLPTPGAEFGEHPYAAARRLFSNRADLR